jgi:Kef-type K+ transport system membrane component KefB
MSPSQARPALFLAAVVILAASQVICRGAVRLGQPPMVGESWSGEGSVNMTQPGVSPLGLDRVYRGGPAITAFPMMDVIITERGLWVRCESPKGRHA